MVVGDKGQLLARYDRVPSKPIPTFSRDFTGVGAMVDFSDPINIQEMFFQRLHVLNLYKFTSEILLSFLSLNILRSQYKEVRIFPDFTESM